MSEFMCQARCINCSAEFINVRAYGSSTPHRRVANAEVKRARSIKKIRVSRFIHVAVDHWKCLRADKLVVHAQPRNRGEGIDFLETAVIPRPCYCLDIRSRIDRRYIKIGRATAVRDSYISRSSIGAVVNHLQYACKIQ